MVGDAHRIVVHDYGAYPFTLELAQQLATRGHEVLYLYSGSVLAPNVRGGFDDGAGDRLVVEAVQLDRPIRKDAFLRRWFGEREYGRRLREAAAAFRPDVVLSANTPLEAQKTLQRWSDRNGARFVYWVQDLYGVAAHRILRRKLPVVGEVVGRYYRRLERKLVGRSDAAVLITDDFLGSLPPAQPSRCNVIPNWAPLERTPVRPRDNPWAREHGLIDGPVFLYSGTLGMKHDPSLLVKVAAAVEPAGGRVAVVSEGAGADWLARETAGGPLQNLSVHPFQPAHRVPDVLATGDVLVALLEPDAGLYSVPSKVLTYLCAGRPVLASLPPGNRAAKMLSEAGAGLVVGPGETEALAGRAIELAENAAVREEMGSAGRAYAEREFEIEAITDRFERVLGVGTEEVTR